MFKKKGIQYYHTSLILFLLLPTYLISQSLTPEQIYKEVSETVVVIHTYNSNNELLKQGSGVVINDSGYIVTNYHVFEGGARLELLHNNDIIPVDSIIGIDEEKDILILKIQEKILPTISLGNSKDLVVGEKIYAIGSPFGLENTISEGIISGLRSIEGNNLIQVTASISQGSSGGAIVDNKGDLIGISSSMLKDGQNLNFAIPINDILAVKIGSYLNNESIYSKVLEARRTGNFTEALSYFENYTEKNPNDALGYYCLGEIKYCLEDYSGAIYYYTKSIKIAPIVAEAYSNRGLAKHFSLDNNGAIKDFYKAMELYNDYAKEGSSTDLSEDYAQIYCNLGMSKISLEDYKGAIKDYTKAIEINPNNADAFINRGLAKYKLSDNNGAIQDYTKTIEINPNYVEAYLDRGSTKAVLKDYRGAILDFTKSIELNPNDAKGYFGRGLTKYALFNNHGAIQDFTKTIEINPNDALAYYYRGVTKGSLEDNHGAIKDYTKAIEINPNYVEAYLDRGITKAVLKDYRGAILDFTKSIELNPNDADGYLRRGAAKYTLGDKNGACLDWSKAGELGSAKAYEWIQQYCK